MLKGSLLCIKKWNLKKEILNLRWLCKRSIKVKVVRKHRAPTGIRTRKPLNTDREASQYAAELPC